MANSFLFRNTRVHVANTSFLMHSITTPWGEDDPILRKLRDGKFDEHASIAHWVALVRAAPPRAIVLDVGAFAGLFSLIAVSIRQDLLAIAFEPSSVTFGRLAYNIQLNALNRQILPAHLAAWDEDRIISLPHKYGLFTLCPGERAARDDQVDHDESVAAVPLDRITNPDDLPNFINSRAYSLDGRPIAAVKIDVEGVEPRVLQGATSLIAQHRPSFICEALNPCAIAILQSFFEEVEYRHAMVPGERNLLAQPADAPMTKASQVRLRAALEGSGA